MPYRSCYRRLLRFVGLPAAVCVSVALTAACGSQAPSLPSASKRTAALGAGAPVKLLAGEVNLDTNWQLVTAPRAMTNHAAVALDHKQVLLTGGLVLDNEAETSSAAAYLFDAKASSFTSLPPMHDDRSGHTATKLLDGRVLVVSGESVTPTSSLSSPALWKPMSLEPSGTPVFSAEIFDPASSQWTKLPELDRGTVFATALGLADGTVLITGGMYDGFSPAALFFDPTSIPNGAFTDAPWLPHGLAGHSLNQVADGTVLAIGGETSDWRTSNDVLSLSPANEWQQEESRLQGFHAYHTATLLKDGRVLITGGQNSDGMPTSGVDIYEWGMGGTAIVNMGLERIHHTAALLPDGRVIVVGGSGHSGALASTEIFDPAIESWSSGPELNVARYRHSMTLLLGKLVVLGGIGSDGEPLDSVEILTFAEEAEPGECSEDKDCPGGTCVDGVCQAAPKDSCEGLADGNSCGDDKGCSIGICLRNACMETAHKLDGSPCEGGVCIAGQCKLDRKPGPSVDGGSAGGGDPGSSGSGTGGESSGDKEDGGGLCSASPGAPRHTPMAIVMALLAGLGLWRRPANRR